MNIWTRRNFLKASGITAMSLGLNAFSPEIFRRRILAGPVGGRKRMIFIFQRGGNDGVNTCIPRGDSQYSTSLRPTLFIPEGPALDLGNGYAQLHPRMAPMMEIYNSSGLTGVDGPGNLAVIHRVGYRGQSQSHFNSQQFWENGTPGEPELEEGMIYRQVVHGTGLENNSLPAAGLSGSQMVALKGPTSIPTLKDPAKFTFSGSPTKVQKLLGQFPTFSQGNDGRGLLGVYGGPRDFSGKAYRDLVYGTGTALADAINIVQDAVRQGPYTPSNGAVYPGGKLGDRLSKAAMLMKRTPVQIMGVNIGGFDNHTNQGQVQGKHGNLLNQVAQSFQALYRDLRDMWQDLIVVTMTEFGRTSKENGSNGTDHAHATVMFVAGGAVRGGVYNCDSATWPSGRTLFSARNRYVDRRTDFRAVFGEIFMRHFGDDLNTLRQVIPTWDSARSQSPGDFNLLNFLPA